MDIKKEYERWLANATADADVVTELKTLDDAKIEDAFYRDLAFGTGGLRGVIGAGTNRMNIYTVAKASQGLADYLKKNFAEPSVVIGYDSRIKSDVFAKVAAGVFAANGVKADSYVFGFEESYGYLTGSYVRDKDGVDGAYMICEMFSYYATKGISLLDKLDELYKTYGYCLNTLHSYEFDGSAGFAKMQSIMQAFRGEIKEFGGKKVVKLLDYAPGLDGLPKSDVLKFLLEDNCSIVVRPSGTEPKLKTYISVSAENKDAAEKVETEICKSAEAYLK